VAKGHNARLRGALLSISQNLRKHNPFFKGWIASKRARKKVSDEKLDTNIACKFSGISFNMLARREVFSHPQGGKGEPILLKIVKFCKESKVDVEKLDQILKDAIGSLPHRACLGEAQAWEDAIKSNCGAGRSLYYDCQRREKILKLLWERITQEMKEDDHAIAVDK
jgi:hypothetical protein